MKPTRHVESLADLSTGEAAALGPLLTKTAKAVTELCKPDQVYACLWSHAGRRPAHIHFVVQPVTNETMDQYGGMYGPELQMAMFQQGPTPDTRSVEEFADKVRPLFAS